MMFPAFLKLSGRRVVLVGGGRVASSKLPGLLEAGAHVTVVAPEIRAELERPGVELMRRPFLETDLDGAWWVVAAAPPEVNRQVQAAAEPRHLFVNAVDDPDHATAYAGGVVRRSGVTVAVSTDGRAPALAGLLREALDACLPPELDDWMSLADEVRHRWRREGVPIDERRPQLLQALNELYEERRRVVVPPGISRDEPGASDVPRVWAAK
jgi:uroporphyrin-III C-methyltransferase/precorrin-2 dehydrogenase/sirohydrochlorin ferrochelatase